MKTIILVILLVVKSSFALANEIVYKPSESISLKIRETEKLSKCAFYDHKAVSIGYGTQRLENLKKVPLRVKGKPFCITEERAMALFNRDVQYKADLIIAMAIDSKLEINQEMLDALVSFSYNIGFNGFYNSSVLSYLLEGKCKKASQALTWYNKASGKVLKGLVIRRKYESELLVKGCSKLIETYTDMEKRRK